MHVVGVHRADDLRGVFRGKVKNRLPAVAKTGRRKNKEEERMNYNATE